RISATIRTARSRSSGGYLLDEPPDMTPSFPRTGVSGHAGAVHLFRITWCLAHFASAVLLGLALSSIAGTR
ncbi:hypothetical protein N7U24_19575, partial [Mycobacterium tuberculosis]|uniref:hypothetical protein n=1 Tax=Mycobacterium tuberculosis TaxID=1773 RepID=UPI0021BFAF26